MGLPSRIGRYEVVAELASGGMAEILLARLVGLNGFERPVVLKRILPHLAREATFVDMFLDEARIVAGIRHPNVVQVQELGHEDGELYLAMEYLDGESVAALMKRLVARGERLPPVLAAHVVAQACAGLQAAHELAGPDGTPMHLVHRDVSPQNLMVTYGGLVKVLDFGIAKAADRITRTETGIVKGKYEYMSPEQCRGKPLDRRSDVFSLGVVLYELLAGKRLFRRDSQMDTFHAICVEPHVPLGAAAPWVDPLFERVTARALAKAPDERFASAADMRRELLEAMQALGGAADPDQELASLLQRLFGDRIDQKAAMLRSVRAGTSPAVVPRSETDLSVEVPGVEGAVEGTAAGTLALNVGESRRAAGGRRGPRLPAAIVIGAAAVAIAGVAALALARRRPSQPAPSSSSPAGSATSGTGPLAFRFANVHRISFGDGCEEFPTLAPDGKTLVYDATAGADSHLVVMDLETKATRALTSVRGWDFAASLSPDGRWVAFLREVGGTAATFLVPIEGGEPRKLAAGTSRPAWSPDGRSVWAGDGAPVVRYDATSGAAVERVALPPGLWAMNTTTLQDGSLVLRVVDANHHGLGAGGLWLVPPDRSLARWLARHDLEEAVVEWPRGGRVLATVGNDADGIDLADVPLDGSPMARLATSDVHPHKGMALSSDARRLVWSTCQAHDTIVRQKGDDLSPVFGMQEWADWEVAWLRDTRDIVVLSDRSGKLQPWVVNLDGAREARAIPVPWEPHTLSVTPDGSRILLGGGRGIAVARVDGTEPVRALTDEPSDADPRALRDGSAVLFSRMTGGVGARVMSVPLTGGPATPFLDEGTRAAVPSPIDDRIVFLAGPEPHSLVPMVLDRRTGRTSALSRDLPPANYGPAHFSGDGRRVALLSGTQAIVEVDLGSGHVTRSAAIGGVGQVEYVGAELLMVAQRWGGNLWMADIQAAP